MFVLPADLAVEAIIGKAVLNSLAFAATRILDGDCSPPRPPFSA